MLPEKPPLFENQFRPKVYLGLCCALLLAWGSWQGWNLYQGHQQKRWVVSAEYYCNIQDWRGASLSARRALFLQKDPAYDLRANLVMARICRELQLPQEIYWRSEILRLSPSSFEAREELIQTALRHNSGALAGQTLETTPPEQQNNARFHKLMAVYALGLHQPPYAVAALRRALQFSPADHDSRLNLAKVLLVYGSDSDQTEIDQLLLSLPDTPENQGEILRCRIHSAQLRKQFPAALVLCEKLAQNPGQTFNDRIVHLNLLFSLRSPQFSSALAQLQEEAGTRAGPVYQLATWMRGAGLAPQALAWLDQFPETLRHEPPLAILWAECALSALDWSRLREELTRQRWNESDSLRLAFLARALRELRAPATEESLLVQQSLNAAKNQPLLSLTLGDLFASWSWQNEAANAWWPSSRSAQGKLALAKLFDLYKNNRDLSGLWRVSQTASESDPLDLVAQNNFAMASLILGNRREAATALARRLQAGDPKNPAFVSTYALALYFQNKTAEALALYRSLPPESLREPAIAPYYILTLLRAGEEKEARAHQAYVKIESLFPEEIALYQEANPPP